MAKKAKTTKSSSNKGSLKNKVILITGGAAGMGRSMALGFAHAGVKGIAIIDTAKASVGKKLMAEIREIAGPNRAIYVSGDVTKPADCKKVVAQAAKKFGTVHVLINNAGLGERATGRGRIPFWKFNEAGMARLMMVNIIGPFLMAKAVAPLMIKQKWGRILNLTKTRESMHAATISGYGPSKAGLEAMALCWAVELLGTGVTVNAFNPGGAVDTDFMTPSQRRKGRAAGTLLSPDIVIPLSLMLASELSDGITGCRFTARHFDPSLPPAKALEDVRDPAIFLPPRRSHPLTQTWKMPKSDKSWRRG
jgi:NAD(P)-dependent dehydrogenase (short-subunit alcohol dehydrogenase family)